MSLVVLSEKQASLRWLMGELGNDAGPFAAAETVEQALGRVAEGGAKLVVVDLAPDAQRALGWVARLREAAPELPILALADEAPTEVVLAAFRAGARDLATRDGAAGALRSAVDRCLDVTGQSGATVTAVFAPSGGAGSTSLCAALADRLHVRSGGEVLLLDLDLYVGGLGSWLAGPCPAGPHELLGRLDRLDRELLDATLARYEGDGFRFSTCEGAVQDAEGVGAGPLASLLATLRSHLDHLVLDLPHDFSRPVLCALEAADRILLVVTPSPASLRRAQAALEFVNEIGATAAVEVVLTRTAAGDDIRPADLERIIGYEPVAQIAEDRSLWAAAARERRPIGRIDAEADASRAIDALAAHLLGQAQPEATAWWRRLFGGTGQ